MHKILHLKSKCKFAFSQLEYNIQNSGLIFIFNLNHEFVCNDLMTTGAHIKFLSNWIDFSLLISFSKRVVNKLLHLSISSGVDPFFGLGGGGGVRKVPKKKIGALCVQSCNITLSAQSAPAKMKIVYSKKKLCLVVFLC